MFVGVRLPSYRLSMRKPKTIQNEFPVKITAIPLDLCLAKTKITQEGFIVPGQDVLAHCVVVGRVAQAIVSIYPEIIRNAWFPQGTDLLAAGHDIGKVCPTFQKKIQSALTNPDQSVLGALTGIDASLEKKWGHSGVSNLAAKSWNLGEYIPAIWGCHHGFRPAVEALSATDTVVGGAEWQSCRVELKNLLELQFGSSYPLVRDALHAKVLSGLISVSDWIGSGQLSDKPLEEISDGDVVDAVHHSGFVPLEVKQELSFEDIFGFPPNETQEQMTIQCSQPGVYVLEAPMGVGKTEAALYAAYRLLATGQATGMYFALPTQTTSEAIYERVNQFLEKILPEHSAMRKALLVHGNSWVKMALMNTMGADAAPGGSWFNARKRGILAPFGVGTVDQALMAVMNVRHGFVRTFGLLGKIVILDEVHSYDMYTGTILDELVSALKSMGCTVIVLSATLTQNRRKQLVGYELASNGYPLLTCSAQEGGRLVEVQLQSPAKTRRRVSLSFCDKEEEAVAEVIEKAKAGEQVLWIENTVDEAQARYLQITSSVISDQVEVGLIHSRFTKNDRAEHETRWVHLLGRRSGHVRNERGRILIGTQVLEQSLDIDADFLVSRICPSDMLLQRLGRLWRHERDNRAASARCQAMILSPGLDKALLDPEKAFGSTGHVYAPYVLCRTLEVWVTLSAVSLPDDIRGILEKTYIDRLEQGALAESRNLMLNGDNSRGRRRIGTTGLRTLALSSLSEIAPAAGDDNVPTRYSQTETVEILLLRDYSEQDSKAHLKLMDGSELELPAADRCRAAAMLQSNCVTVPEYAAVEPQTSSDLQYFARLMYISHDKRHCFRITVVNSDGKLFSPFENCRQSGFVYDHRIGYRKLKT